MKKISLKLSPLLLFALLLAGCKDKNEVKKTEPEFPTQFSDKTVTQNKQSLEDNGIALTNSITDLKNSSGIQTSIAFSSFLENNPPDNLQSGRLSSNGGAIHLLSSLGSGKSSLKETLSGMRTASDFTSFQAEYNKAEGIYTYSKSTDTWSFEQTGDKIVFNFPSTKTGTLNNAQYTIYDFKSVTITSELGGDDYNGDYPTGLKTNLTIDGVKKMDYSFSAAYNTAGDPSDVSIALAVDDFTFDYKVLNTTSNASIDYSLKRGSKVLFALGASAIGTFNSSTVENSDDADDVVNSAKAYFQIENIKFSSSVDTKTLVPALDVAANSLEKQAVAWNTSFKLLVFYDDTKKKIADSEIYVVESTDPFQPEGHLEIRMIFADGTKSDLATYTDAGFEDLKTQLDKLLDN